MKLTTKHPDKFRKGLHYKRCRTGWAGQFGSNRYQLIIPCGVVVFNTRVKPARNVNFQGGTLYAYSGDLYLPCGWKCDGPSGPTVDEDANMRAAFVHDWLCRANVTGLIPWSERKKIDQTFHDLLLEDGFPAWRARYYLWAVQFFSWAHPALERVGLADRSK